MKLTLKKQDILKYLLITVFISTTLCFAIKYMGVSGIIPWEFGYSDTTGYALTKGQKNVFLPGMPYIDKPLEYPVIMGMTIYLASRFGLGFYLFSHYIIFLLCALISTKYLYKLATLLNTKKKYLFIFWALAPSMLWFVYFNWDIIAVTFSILALYYYKEKKDILATIFLSLGFATKMYPILFLFPLLMHRKFASWIKLGITFVLTFIAVNIYFMINNFQTWSFIYGFHSLREPNIDSIWAVIMNFLPGLSIQSVNLITLLLFASIYLYINIKFRKKDFIFLSFLSLMLFLITNKVFSPQFTIWLLPFFALYGVKYIPFYTFELSNILVLFTTLTHIFSGKVFTIALIFSALFVVVRHVALVYIYVKAAGSKELS